MKEKSEEKTSVSEGTPTPDHEDIALKVTAQFFRDEIMPMLNIEGEVVSILPTESIHLELKRGFEDFNYLMSDDSIKHFEFESDNEGKAGLKRFRLYEAQMSYQLKKPVTTYVLFSGRIKRPMTEFTEGVNTYRIVPIIMQDKNADEVIAKLQKKVDAGEVITKDDMLPLVLCPLMSGKLSQKERVSAAYDITRKATVADADVIRKVEAVIYIMAEKFLDSAEMEQLKEEIKMTRLGKMIFDDGRIVGMAEGKAEGKAEERGLIFKLIQCMKEDGALEKIPELSTNPEFFTAMMKKYCVE